LIELTQSLLAYTYLLYIIQLGILTITIIVNLECWRWSITYLSHSQYIQCFFFTSEFCVVFSL